MAEQLPGIRYPFSELQTMYEALSKWQFTLAQQEVDQVTPEALTNIVSAMDELWPYMGHACLVAGRGISVSHDQNGMRQVEDYNDGEFKPFISCGFSNLRTVNNNNGVEQKVVQLGTLFRPLSNSKESPSWKRVIFHPLLCRILPVKSTE